MYPMGRGRWGGEEGEGERLCQQQQDTCSLAERDWRDCPYVIMQGSVVALARGMLGLCLVPTMLAPVVRYHGEILIVRPRLRESINT